MMKPKPAARRAEALSLVLACVFLAFSRTDLVAQKLTVMGTVLDANGRPVKGATIAPHWLVEKGRWRSTGANSDAQGHFRLELDLYNGARSLLAVDARHETGALVNVGGTNAAQGITVRLVPMVSVRGEYYCPELSEPIGWCNTCFPYPTNGLFIMEGRSDVGTFEVKLPPGQYGFLGYDDIAAERSRRTLELTAIQPVLDLGRIDLKATPLALSWGRPSPAWHITEARGLPATATVADFRGQWLLLDFWGYWCGPCIRAMPALFEFYDRHAGQRSCFEIVAVHRGSPSLKAMDRSLAGTIRGLWGGRTLPFPVIVDGEETTFKNFGIAGYPTQLLLDPDGRIVRDGDVAFLESVLALRDRFVFALATSPDGNRTAQGTEEGNVRLFSAGEGKPRLLPAGSSAINCVAFSPDGGILAAGSRDGAIHLWNLESDKETGQLQGHTGPVFALAFAPDGRSLVSAGFDTTRRWDLARASETPGFFKRLFPAWSLVFSPDGKRLAAGGAAAIQVWEAETGQEIATCQRSGPVIYRCLAFSPDGQTLAGGGGNAAALWSVSTGRVLRELGPVTGAVTWLRFAADGKTVTALTSGRTVRSWNVAEGRTCAGGTAEARLAGELADRLPDDAGALASEAWAAALERNCSAGDYQAALARARTATQSAPANEAAWRALGACLCRAGQFKEAVAALDQAARLKKSASSGYRDLPADQVFRALALRGLGEEDALRATVMRFWGLAWEDGRPGNGVFEELNAALFGPRSEVARPFVLSQLRNGVPPAEIPAILELHPELDAEAGAAARRILPCAYALWQVEKARRQIGLRERVVKEVEQAPGLDPLWRPAATDFARRTVEDADSLNALSWAVVAQPERTAADYALALEQAEAAYHLNHDDAIRNTLGVALYRSGHYERAAEVLRESEFSSPEGIAAPSDLPFLAMAFEKLGRHDEAKRRFDQLANILQRQQQPDAETIAFFHEAEQVLGARAPAELTPRPRQPSR
jgi:Flp pilus assembly protein TadD/thiol-disulfide isomerase/thioredoxin